MPVDIMDKLAQPMVVVGILALVIFKLVERRERENEKRIERNGGGTQTRLLRELVEVSRDHNMEMAQQHDRTRTTIMSGFDALAAKLERHDRRSDDRHDALERTIDDLGRRKEAQSGTP